MKVWNIVKYAIKSSGKTYKQVSINIGKSQNYISAQLAQKYSPSVQTLGIILDEVGWHLEAVSDATGERITIE